MECFYGANWPMAILSHLFSVLSATASSDVKNLCYTGRPFNFAMFKGTDGQYSCASRMCRNSFSQSL